MPTSHSSLPTSGIVVIGNEILSGRTQDKNLHWLAGELTKSGIRVAEAVIVPDKEESIVAAVNRYRGMYDYVFTSGGIGPTHDDITSAAIAAAFGTPLERNAEAEAILRHYYGAGHLTGPRLKMADIPRGAALIENPVSGAPGFNLENVWVMAGVPSIFQAMFAGIRHLLAGGPPIQSTSTTVMIAESAVAIPLGQLQEQFQQFEIGSYPFIRDGVVGTRLVISGTDAGSLQDATRQLHRILDGKGADYRCDSPLPA